MSHASQDNFLLLAKEAKKHNDLPQAKQYLLEALRLGHDSDIVKPREGRSGIFLD